MQQHRREKGARDAHGEVHQDAEEERVDDLNERRNESLTTEEVGRVQKREQPRRDERHDDLTMPRVAHDPHDVTAGQHLLGEADEEPGEKPGHHVVDAGCAVVDAQQVKHVEHEHHGDRDPHPSAPPEGLSCEKPSQPTGRRPEDDQDECADEDRQDVEDENERCGTRIASERHERDEGERREFVEDEVGDGEDDGLPPATTVPETGPGRLAGVIDHEAPPSARASGVRRR